MKVVRYVESTIKGILLNFSYILRKSIATAFVKQNIQILYWVPVMFVVTYFLDGCGQKWVWSFRSWNSEICSISREWIDKNELFFFFAFWYKFRKANVNLVISGWALDHTGL